MIPPKFSGKLDLVSGFEEEGVGGGGGKIGFGLWGAEDLRLQSRCRGQQRASALPRPSWPTYFRERILPAETSSWI